jgi:hypothetical protein
MIFEGLQVYVSLRELQGKFLDAVTFAEEGYNVVVEAYDPVHPKTQEAASILIQLLIKKGDFYNAERFAVITYGNLRDKKNGIDQDSEMVAAGAFNLAGVIYQQQGNLVKAEELAREALRIRELVYPSHHHHIGILIFSTYAISAGLHYSCKEHFL